jgi:hypothetical protein
MFMEVIGFLIVISHVILVACIILWFGLGKPTTMAKFVAQFKLQFLGIGRQAKQARPREVGAPAAQTGPR